jgi:PAS domain S-box-containing protein
LFTHLPIQATKDRIQQIFFFRMVFTVFVFISLYAAVYFALGARLSACILLVGCICFTPALLLLDRFGHPNLARFFFCITGLLYIYATPLGIRVPIDIEYYYLAALMAPGLLFLPSQKVPLLAAMAACPLVWGLQYWGPLPELSGYWIATEFPQSFFCPANFLGSAAIMSLFLRFYVERISLSRQELERISKRQEYILEGAGLGSWDWWLETNKVVYDRRWATMLGLDYDSMPQELSTWEKRVHPDDKNKAYDDIKAFLAGRTNIYENVHRMRHANGSWVWILDRGRISERDPSGKPLRFTGTHFEVTAFKETELLSANIQKMAQIGGWELEVPSLKSHLTEEAYRIYALPPGTPVSPDYGMSFFVDQPRIRDLVQKCIQGMPFRETLEFMDACGHRKWVESMGEPALDSIGNVYRIRGTIQDITAKRLAELELEQTEREVDQFFNISLDLLCIAGMDGRFRKLNPTFTSLLGYSTDELTSRPFVDYVHPDDVEATLLEVKKLSEGLPTIHFENRYRCKDGSYRILSWATSPDPRTGLLYAAARDITDMRGTEQELRRSLEAINESERQLEEAQRVAKLGSWSYDVVSGKIHWSRQMFDLFDESVHRGPPTLERHRATIHPDDLPLWSQTVDACFQDAKPYRMRFRSVFGHKVLWIEALGHAQLDGKGRVVGLSGTCQDITELVRAEDETKMERAKSLQSAKLASLGEMSAGIAHEINNPLAIITGAADLLYKSLADPEKTRSRLQTIQRASDRIAKIVGGLRKFSRSSEKSEHCPHVLAEIIKEAVVLTEAKSKRHSVPVYLELKTAIAITCDEIEIEQVLVILINNGIDAVKASSEKWVRVSLFEQAEAVVLQVRDSGRGIPTEIAKKMFQPFFTTKTVGEGTGLGLSIAKGILDVHKASIEILENDPNTCFEIRFLRT